MAKVALHVGQAEDPAKTLLGAIERLDGAQVQALVASAESMGKAPKRWASAPWSEALRALEPGSAEVPALAIRPGQTQLGFDHAASRMAKIAKRLLEDPPKRLADLFDEKDFRGVVGPDGGFFTLTDGHHKMAALLALSALVHGVLGTGTAASSRTAPQVGGAFRKLAALVPPPAELRVPVFVERQLSAIGAGEPSADRLRGYLEQFGPPGGLPSLYLGLRGGGEAAGPPERFSDLQDNPYRRLAAELVSTFSWDDHGAPVFKRSDRPLWLKGPDAPEYVEFHLAEVLERVSLAEGHPYVPGKPIPDPLLHEFRVALAAARADGHPALGRVITFEHATDWGGLRRALDLVDRTAFVPGESELDPEAVPVLVLPDGTPDVHRLHAAAHLLGALAGEAKPEALGPDLAKEVISRLVSVPDELGLWVNRAGLTRAELERDAKLARRLAVSVSPKKSKLRIEGEPAERPLWIELPGAPAAAFALADLWGDLFSSVDHQPGRLGEIEALARQRLIEAKTQPGHRAYSRLSNVPAVVEGDASAVVASLRVRKKDGALEVGHPVEGSPPHVLPPRQRAVVRGPKD